MSMTLSTRIPTGDARRIGYARVSTQGQSLESQLQSLTEAGCGRVWLEKVSATARVRPAWDALLAELAQGDVLVVVRLDRLGRRLRDVVGAMEVLTERKVGLVALAQGIDTTKAEGRIVAPIWAALAEVEREVMAERTRAGIAAARASGRPPGRKRKATAELGRAAMVLRAEGRSLRDCAKHLGVSYGTVREALRVAEGRAVDAW